MLAQLRWECGQTDLAIATTNPILDTVGTKHAAIGPVIQLQRLMAIFKKDCSSGSFWILSSHYIFNGCYHIQVQEWSDRELLKCS